jgi:hypothetical protein
VVIEASLNTGFHFEASKLSEYLDWTETGLHAVNVSVTRMLPRSQGDGPVDVCGADMAMH